MFVYDYLCLIWESGGRWTDQDPLGMDLFPQISAEACSAADAAIIDAVDRTRGLGGSQLYLFVVMCKKTWNTGFFGQICLWEQNVKGNQADMFFGESIVYR